VFENSFEDIVFLLERMGEAGVKPECECFDVGHVESVEPLLDLGVLAPPVQFSLIHGVLGGVSATAHNLAHMASVVPAGSTWGVIAISRDQWRWWVPRHPWGGTSGSGSRTTSISPGARWPPPTEIWSRRPPRSWRWRDGRSPLRTRPVDSWHSRVTPTARPFSGADRVAEVRSGMVANVWKVVAAAGDTVDIGDPLVILESMKMEIPVEASQGGTVKEVRVEEGAVVQEGDVVAVIE
jgi:hypothetical protein